MAGNKIICNKNEVSYSDIRKAMTSGARTASEVGACGNCDGCRKKLDDVLKSVCGCKKVSLEAVINAVESGADTVEKVEKVTKAGVSCGRCKALVGNIIELGR